MIGLSYLSVCSGVEAASLAWGPLGWRCVGVSEIDRFASEILAARFGSNLPGAPLASNGVPNFGDMTRFQEWPDLAIDLLVGGTPCQSFSVAGLRAGLADPRGNLALVYCGLLDRYRPKRFIWENVPGVLSSNGGRDFGALLGALAELGYGVAWRVLDAQFVRVDGHGRAVPQRRARLFVVGYSGADWRRAGAVLFDAASLRGDSAPRREARQGVASAVGGGPDGGGVSGAVTSKWAKGTGGPAGDEAGNLVAVAFEWQGAGNQTSLGFDPASGVAPALACNRTPAVVFDLRGREDGAQFEGPHDTAAVRAASGGSSRSYVATDWRVRRLTPLECERLQGFPDDWTAIARANGKPAADGPRYKAIGNSMAVNVMRWIGRRIEMVDAIGDGERPQ